MPVHMVVRGNNKQVVFAEDEDFQAYLAWLGEGLLSTACRLHAYVLMSNHVHLLVSAEVPSNLSKLPQYIGRRYVPYFNHKYGRTGTIWEGRFKASSIESGKRGQYLSYPHKSRRHRSQIYANILLGLP